MDKETVVASLRAELSVTEDLRDFLGTFSANKDAWFVKEGGESFLAEFGHEWNKQFKDVAQSYYDRFFRALGVPENLLPQVKVTDSRRGSWLIDAVLYFPVAIGTTFAILKGIADLPELAEKLDKTKEQVRAELDARFKAKVRERIEPTISNAIPAVALPASVRANPVVTSFSIDARPLRGLTAETVKSHAIHLAVGVSRSAISVENLGDTKIENLRIGLFRSTSQQHSWSFADAFSRNVPTLSSKQSISIATNEFLAQDGVSRLALTDAASLYVDCWLQDNNGIYLFNFCLE